MDNNYENESIHTKLSYYLILISIVFELYLAFKYINSPNKDDSLFGFITLTEGIIALVGLILTDPIRGHRLRLKPRKFRKTSPFTFFRAIIILAVLLIIQAIFQAIPLTIRNEDVAIAIVNAAPAEESFFRGFLMSIFINLSSILTIKTFRLPGNKEISIVELIGMTISSLLFALLHVNYYGNMNLMGMVFCSGFALVFFYWCWRDLTANILAHLFLNIWVVGKFFWMVFF